MALIRANRESIDDRFSVLGFTVRTENPLFEIGLATDPELLKAENRQRRTPSNFFSSRVLGAAASRRSEAVYLVPPNVVARFVGQSRLYFGLATYREGDRSQPATVKIPDAGSMYVSLSGLTERGLRRTARFDGAGTYGGNGGNGGGLVWGGDTLSAVSPGTGHGSGNGNGGTPPDASVSARSAPYSDGYSDELWQPGAPAPASVNGNGNAQAATGSGTGHGDGAAAAHVPAVNGTPPPVATAQDVLLEPYYRSDSPVTALLDQIAFFAQAASWFVGVDDTRCLPHSAICAARLPSGGGDTEHGTAFYIGRNLLLTAAHVVDGQSELIIVPGMSGSGNEPFGRFRVRAADWVIHPSYNSASRDFDFAIIKTSQAAPNGQWFDLIEELRESRPEGVVVCGYSVQSRGSAAIHRIINHAIDGAKQHVHGGYVRSLTDETFGYDIQTLAGASGSPVYWIESGTTPQAHLVGVHVAGDSAVTNLGCRLTDAKIAWIRARAADWGQSNAMALGRTRALGTGRALGIGATRAYARAQEVITPFYDPADPASALTCQADAFSLAREEWFAGVPNTTLFPHSAICLLEMKNAAGGVVSRGTGFYVGPNRILTCGHNLHDAARTSVDIVPGKNGQGGGTEPFGRCNVPRASWRIPNSYAGPNTGFDLAVIDNVPTAAPGGRWFDVLEELRESRPEGVVVCGYSSRSVRVPDLTAAIDGFKQHLHAGYIAALGPGESTFDYPILTLKRASGSPVYYLSAKGGTMQAYVVGVHTGSVNDADDVNRGCRLTDSKIAWIEGRTTSLGLSAPSRALIIGPDDVQQAQQYAPQWADLFNWTAPGTLDGTLAARGMRIQRIQDAIGALNLDRYEVRCTALPAGWSDVALMNHLRNHLNDFIDTDNSEFIPYAVGTDDVQWGSASPVGAVFKIDIVGPDNAAVVGSLVEDRRFRFTTINAPWSGDHPVSGHREFGVRRDGDATVFYTRGADRATTGLVETVVFAGAHHLWLSFQRKLCDWINANGGSATVLAPFSERFHPEVVRILYGSTTQALSRPLEIPLDPGIGGQSIGLEALSPGDIIVSTASHPVSYAIRAGTLSAISHAMLYVGGGNIVEAVGDGVREAPLASVIDNAILAVAYRDPRVDATKAAALVNFARAQVGQPYNYGGVARAGYRIAHPLASRVLDAIRDMAGVDDATARSFYCSELVFAAFEAAGIPLVAQAADASTPDDLVRLSRGSLGYVGHLKARDEFLGVALALSAPRARGLSADSADIPVPLIPQPNKNACWAASMAMLLSWRRNASYSPETLANEVGGSLASSYSWDLLNAVRDRYGFTVIEQPANASLYHTPRQWAQWLNGFGALWVVIVGAPHAVVVAGIRGNLDDAASVQVKLLNPWDTRVSFDNDPVEFRPPNGGYQDWIGFQQFAADFGNMAEPDYGNWRVLHLPASAAKAQSLGAYRGNAALRLARPPAPVRMLSETPADTREPIEPSRIAGTRMSVVRGGIGAVRWALDQLEGLKSPATPNLTVSSAAPADVQVALNDWPAMEGEATPLPLMVSFRASAGSVGDVQIRTGTPTQLAYGVEVTARIDDSPDVGNVAALKVSVEYRFSGLAHGNPAARIDLRLLGDGRFERENRWVENGSLMSA